MRSNQTQQILPTIAENDDQPVQEQRVVKYTNIPVDNGSQEERQLFSITFSNSIESIKLQSLGLQIEKESAALTELVYRFNSVQEFAKTVNKSVGVLIAQSSAMIELLK